MATLKHLHSVRGLDVEILEYRGVLYVSWVKRWATPQGEWMWGISNMVTGLGQSGCSESKAKAEATAAWAIHRDVESLEALS